MTELEHFWPVNMICHCLKIILSPGILRLYKGKAILRCCQKVVKFNTNLSPEIKKGFDCEVYLTVPLLLQKSDLDPCAGRP